MTTEKTIALTMQTLISKVMPWLLNTLSACHSFSSKESFNFVAAVTICSDFGAQENEICHCFHFFPIYLPWSDGTRFHDLFLLLLLCFKLAFSLSSFTFISGFLVPPLFLPSGWYHLHIWGSWYFSWQIGPSLCIIQSSISHEVKSLSRVRLFATP